MSYPSTHNCGPRRPHFWTKLTLGQKHYCAEHGSQYEVQVVPTLTRDYAGVYRTKDKLRWVETTVRGR